ncbi:MAG: efflux RND transporter periplasmic adaptor subunit [Balneolaceae bacterium]
MAKQKRKKTLWISLLIIIVLGGGASFYLYSNTSEEAPETEPHVTAEIGTIVEKALAVGTIEPENEIEVKSKISGVVNRLYAEAGDYVKKGDPLVEMRDGKSFIEVPGEEPGSRVEKEITIGMSDAITVAVIEGLEVGEKVLERPVRTLTVR